MRFIFMAVFIFMNTIAFCQSPAYKDAWKQLDKNNRTEAEKLLQQALREAPSNTDAFITNLYLQTYNDKFVTDLESVLYNNNPDPYPYIYALWFNKSVLGKYGKKTAAHQTGLMNRLITDPKAHGTLVAGANYQKAMHHILSGEFQKKDSYGTAIGSIRNWQFTGPFENLSGSGFYKNYGPVDHPEPDAVFKSFTNADIKWFSPAAELKEGWLMLNYNFGQSSAVIYAQSFVNSATSQNVICNLGFSGAVKVWINDELVISESKELETEFDSRSVKYKLEKGANRVLVQLSFSNNSAPYFAVRFTDETYRPLSTVSGSSTYAAYPKRTTTVTHELIPQFAEIFFNDKIKNEPENAVNYLLLADVYKRARQLVEARNTISTALGKAPHNSLLRMKLLEILILENNRTLLLEELEKIKQDDPNSVMVMDMNIEELIKNEKFEEGEAELARRIELHGESESTDGTKMTLLVHDKKYEELLEHAEKMYAKYPENAELILLKYTIEKEVNQDKKAALKVYERYLNNSYSYSTYIQYADLLIEAGDTKKGLAMKDKLVSDFPYDPASPYNLAKYYFSAKNYDKAESYLNKSLSLAPYVETLWELSGDIRNEQNRKREALEAYRRSLQLNPNQFDLISKTRKLDGRQEISKMFPQADVFDVIASDDPAIAKNADHGFYYILDQKDVVIYPEGASEEFMTVLVRITNEKGVERFKESSLGYDDNQNLLVEKAEIIKKSKARIEGERDGNQVVFTNLEVGDIVHFKYRLQTYATGRLAKEFWDKFNVTGQIYTAVSRYHLMAPHNQKIYYKTNNGKLEMSEKKLDEFTLYSWEAKDLDPVKDEPLMPLLADAGLVLHISTIPSWQEIATWYSDAVHNKSEEDIEIRTLFKTLFPEGQKQMTEFEKAKIIYDYIEANIRYSSVSFRQSGLIPQRASATLTTRLGDCKDLSNLFVTLAHMAGINSQLVLVDTRDNGQKDILLPSVDFNHCIVRATLDNKSYYIEMTDNYLPFASLPNNLNGAIALEIPSKSVNEKAELIHLAAKNRTRDVIRRVINIVPEEDDLAVTMQTVVSGSGSSVLRYSYRNSNPDRQKADMEQNIGASFKNNVKLEKVDFENLDNTLDSVKSSVKFKVINEINEIGSMKTFKITYPDIIATLDNFSADSREYPVEYWNYEDVDAYETVVYINAAKGSSFVEVPKSQVLEFRDMIYSLQYTLISPQKIKVERKFTHERAQQISASDYPLFRSFFEKIVKAEQKFIAFK